GREREVERGGRHLPEVAVAFHHGQPEAVLQLLGSPQPGHLAPVGAQELAQVSGDRLRVNQRPVQVEHQNLSHGTSQPASPAAEYGGAPFPVKITFRAAPSSGPAQRAAAGPFANSPVRGHLTYATR